MVYEGRFVLPSRRKQQGVFGFSRRNAILEFPIVLQNVRPQFLFNFVAYDVAGIREPELPKSSIADRWPTRRFAHQ